MRTTVGGHTVLDLIVVSGSANFHGAQILGILSFVNAIVEKQKDTALNLGSAEIGINLEMDGIQVVGRTDAHSLRVKEALKLTHADLNSLWRVSENQVLAGVLGVFKTAGPWQLFFLLASQGLSVRIRVQ